MKYIKPPYGIEYLSYTGHKSHRRITCILLMLVPFTILFISKGHVRVVIRVVSIWIERHHHANHERPYSA
jgi:hypothetical protein